MAELSFLTIIVSLAVCSLLIYAVFQYMKIRLTILEQSHKEQALILQQFIEESSTDIHRLYQLSSNNGSRTYMQPQDSIILEYANDFANHDGTTTSYTKPMAAYNEPHIIHLDTALFKNNNKSNLIEISSDSEDTTESESESSEGSGNKESDSDSDSDGSENGDRDSDSSENEDSDSDSDGGEDREPDPTIDGVVSDIIEVVCDPEPISDIKLVTVDLGVIQESLLPHPSSPPEHKNDVLSMLYKKAQETSSSSEATETDIQPSDVVDAPAPPTTPAPAQAQAPPPSLSTMSVPELRHLLKEKYKNNPEKHPEIQKLKKVELIYALQTTQ